MVANNAVVIKADPKPRSECLKQDMVSIIERDIIHNYLLYPEDVQAIADFASTLLAKNMQERR